jgi:hypothetical protein
MTALSRGRDLPSMMLAGHPSTWSTSLRHTRAEVHDGLFVERFGEADAGGVRALDGLSSPAVLTTKSVSSKTWWWSA